MTLRKLVRITLFTLGTFFGIVAIAVLSVVIYFSEPHIEVTEIRTTSEPQTVKVRWYLSCEEEFFVDDKNKKFYDPQVPAGGVYPGVGPVMSSDIKFVLVGYPYKERRRNIFTGTVSEQRSERFDVIEWHVVTPYPTLVGDEFVESNKPLGWKSNKSDAKYFSQSDKRHRSGC